MGTDRLFAGQRLDSGTGLYYYNARRVRYAIIFHTEEVISLKFSELVRLLERNGFELVREKGSIRYYGKPGIDKSIRIDYHGWFQRGADRDMQCHSESGWLEAERVAL